MLRGLGLSSLGSAAARGEVFVPAAPRRLRSGLAVACGVPVSRVLLHDASQRWASTACFWVLCSSGRPEWHFCETLGEGLRGPLLQPSLGAGLAGPLVTAGFCHPAVQPPGPPCSESCASGVLGVPEHRLRAWRGAATGQLHPSREAMVGGAHSPVKNQPLLLLRFFSSLEMGSKMPTPRD